MKMKVFNIMVFILQNPLVISLKIYKSDKSDQEFSSEKLVAGLEFQKSAKQNNFMSNDFTACIRTQLKILGIGKEARLLQIGNFKKSEFLRLYARYPVTWFSFGNPKFVSWPLRDPMTKDIIYSHFVWKIDLWNHICFSYSETNSYTSFVKVRNM